MTDASSPIPCTLFPGDGIGPEITAATLAVLDALGAPFEWHAHVAGATAAARGDDPLPEAALADLRATRLALKGPLATPLGSGYRSVNVRLREAFQLYANVRPGRSLLPDGKFPDVDLVLVRENTGGFYVGVEHFIPIGDDPHAVAEATGILTREICRRIAEFTFEYALKHGRRKVTVVHKANILKSLTGLFLETVQDVAAAYRDRVVLEDRIVDNCAMQLVLNPAQFDMILTTNMFGDILSDEVAGLIGGLGLAPSANIGKDAAIFEAVHGSAPDIAGQDKANPTALMLSAALMLEHCGHLERGRRLREAVVRTVATPATRTGDLGGPLGTRAFADAVIENL
ncbi:MAG: isocitrate/isopropylmalate dehydrogenase family protein [Gammaproteobacteria bacterium]|nr:isocitrate/isopropylmalate dehydrogenase family protein [Gammaproteobacteria bacterium]MCP5201227.1 isocitrate/isopropylmalate dehydrogenase family protein [Gammaproteobacteria bacterium]